MDRSKFSTKLQIKKQLIKTKPTNQTSKTFFPTHLYEP